MKEPRFKPGDPVEFARRSWQVLSVLRDPSGQRHAYLIRSHLEGMKDLLKAEEDLREIRVDTIG